MLIKSMTYKKKGTVTPPLYGAVLIATARLPHTIGFLFHVSLYRGCKDYGAYSF